ncbi:MAG: ATP-binding cassette domain-containing protein, partial [Desulfobacterales bacterium]
MLLEVKNLNAGYGFLQILRDVSLTVDTGEYVCLVGPNGAGKSTTLKSIAGLLAPMSGEILFKGEPIGGLPGNQVAGKGIAFVSEEMNLFVNMTVQE